MAGIRLAVAALLKRLPSPLTRLVVLAADGVVPHRRRSFRQAGVTTVGDAPARLFIGPANSAGQGLAWARAVERSGLASAANFVCRRDDDVFQFDADHSVPMSVFTGNQRWQRAQRRHVTHHFTHVLLESGRHLFGRQSSVHEQVEFLQSRGLKVALLWHGSDIRIPSVHAASDPDSPFNGAYGDTQVLEVLTRRNHELLATTGLPTFVSTTGLLQFVPAATWLPVVVEPEKWAAAGSQPALDRRRLVVVHAPSRAGLKGSAAIAEVMDRLHGEGTIEYREITGVPSGQMPEVYGSADVVLDTFATGNYGVAACEAMAAGRLVVSHVTDHARNAVRESTGFDLPVVQSRARDLEETLRAIVAERDRYRPVIARGTDFVHEIHDGRRSVQALTPFLMHQQ